MVSTLMTHAKGYHVSFDSLSDYEPPAGTRSWSPIAHTDFAKVVRETIDNHGYLITKEQYAITKDGARMFGIYDLDLNDSYILPGEVNLSIGIRNSIDKSLAGTILAGEVVFICSNRAFSATIFEFRKHTRYFRRDLEAKVDTAIARCGEHACEVLRKILRLKAFECDDRLAHDIIIRAADAGACQWRDIPKVLKAWRNPLHVDFQDRNGWSLYNAFTEVAKARFDSHPQQAVIASLKLNRLSPFMEVN